MRWLSGRPRNSGVGLRVARLQTVLQAPLLALRRGGNGSEQCFGGLEQRLAFARSLLSQSLIAAHDQALARIRIAVDLGEVGLAEHRALHRA